MFRCILYLDRGGISPINHWEVLGRIDIENDLTTTFETEGKHGSYEYRIWKKRQGKRPWYKNKLKNFPRESYHPWEMVRRMLNKAAERNGGHI